MYGKVCAKVIRRKNKTGYSYNFIVAKNRRNPMSGKAEYLVVWNFGTLRDYELKDKEKAFRFWKEVALVLTNLINEGKIYQNCGSEIKARFAKYIPVPVVHARIARPQIDTSIGERLRERFKDLLPPL